MYTQAVGPILQLNWSEIEEENCELRTNRHKTGKVYTVHIFIQPDRRQFLRQQREKVIEEFKTEPKFIFASSKNTVDGTICRGLQEVFQLYFGDDPQKVNFNANSIRKFWERMWTNIKGQVTEGVNRAHFAQTAHSEKTAHEKYLSKNGTREERNQVLDIYLDRLGNRRDDEVLEEFIPAPPNEDVNSDFEDDVNEGERIAPKTPLPLALVKRFNLLRDSLQVHNSTPVQTSSSSQHVAPQQEDPEPVRSHNPGLQPAPKPRNPAPQHKSKQTVARPRDSLDSTIEDHQGSAVQSYMKSLRNFRSKPGKPEWTEEQREACRLFENCRGTVNRNEVKKRIEEGGFVLTDAQCDRIYEKIKTAVHVFKPKKH